MQLVTGFTFDFVGLCVEAKYHGFDWARSYPKSIKKVMKYVLVIIIIGSTRSVCGKGGVRACVLLGGRYCVRARLFLHGRLNAAMCFGVPRQAATSRGAHILPFLPANQKTELSFQLTPPPPLRL